MGTINQLKYWAYKILPLVYDNSLSYYEVLSKVTSKVNEVINTTNQLPDAISEEIKKQLNGDGDVYNNLFKGIVNAIATDEDDATYSANDKEGGELIWLNGTLYEVVRTMEAGTNYIVGNNIVQVSMDTLLSGILKTISANNEYWNTRATTNHDTGTYLWWKGVLYRVDADIKVNDIINIMTTENGTTTGQLTAVTVMDEITKHYLEMHEADNNLQTQIDGNDGDIEKLQKEDTNLQNQITRNNSDVNSRINGIVAQSGNDNTEIVDARTGVSRLNSVNYDSLGESIRTMINSCVGSQSYATFPTYDDGKSKLSDAANNTLLYTYASRWSDLPDWLATATMSDLSSTFCVLLTRKSSTGVIQILYTTNPCCRIAERHLLGENASIDGVKWHSLLQNNLSEISNKESYDLQDGLLYRYNGKNPNYLEYKQSTYVGKNRIFLGTRAGAQFYNETTGKWESSFSYVVQGTEIPDNQEVDEDGKYDLNYLSSNTIEFSIPSLWKNRPDEDYDISYFLCFNHATTSKAWQFYINYPQMRLYYRFATEYSPLTNGTPSFTEWKEITYGNASGTSNDSIYNAAATYYAYGDSTTWGQNGGGSGQASVTYPKVVAKALHMVEHNQGVAGQGLLKDWNTIQNYVSNIPSTASLITIGWAYNDGSQYINYNFGSKDSTDLDSVIGRYFNIMKAFQEKCPNAMVVLLTGFGSNADNGGALSRPAEYQWTRTYNFKDSSHTVGELYDTLEEMCHTNGWCCINQHKGSWVNKYNWNTMIANTDGLNIHPGVAGYTAYGKYVAGKLSALYQNIKM